MLPVDPSKLDPEALQRNLRTYSQRCEAAIKILAKHCGQSQSNEVRRLRTCAKYFETYRQQRGETEQLQDARRRGFPLPTVFELVFTYADGGPKGFGYLYEGGGLNNLPDKISVLVQGAVAIHKEGGGTQEEALLFARIFRTIYPDIGALADYDESATTLIVGVVPDGERTRLKTYFNSRLYTGSAHRDRLLQVLELLGIPQHIEAYDILYRRELGTRFQGIGIDLGSRAKRVKFYTHMDRAAVHSHFQRVGEALGVISSENSDALEQAQDFMQALGRDKLADDVELAVGLSENKGPTLKLTQFYTGTDPQRPYKTISQYLQRLGYNPVPFEEAVRALGKNVRNPNTEPHAVHGVGIELPAGKTLKVNLYLRPLL